MKIENLCIFQKIYLFSFDSFFLIEENRIVKRRNVMENEKRAVCKKHTALDFCGKGLLADPVYKGGNLIKFFLCERP